ncbi:hypothetical protein SLE2022_058990 [Rubroshorea leprosula]
MATVARMPSIPHRWSRIFSHWQQQLPLNITVNTLRCNFAEERHTPYAYHAILVFIIPTLINLIEVKYQANKHSPFDAYPLSTMVAVTSLLVYCFAYGAEIAFASSSYAKVFQVSMTVFGSISVASLASILLPGSMQSIVYVLYILLSIGELHDIIRQLYQRIHQKIITMFLNAFHIQQWHVRRTPPILPLTFMDANCMLEMSALQVTNS